MSDITIDLSIVIVSFNTKTLLEACLKSVFRQAHEWDFRVEVVVVDNGSTDGSVELLYKHFPNVKLIVNQENLGFAAANNLGVAQASGIYVLLLNSDTELLEHALKLFYANMVQHRARISSCQLVNSDGSIQPQGGYLPSLFRIAAWMFFCDDVPILRSFIRAYHVERLRFFMRNRRMGWVGGTAMMVERATYALLGGLDEKIFMYAEDVEFCWRAHPAGRG